MIGQVDDPHFWTMDALLIVVGALALTAGLIIMLRPWLRRYALARPNARSLHHNPTPQGGGMAVVAATVLIAGAAILAGPELAAQSGIRLLVVIGATAVLTVTGALDDVFALGPAPRLVLQVLAVGCTVATLPTDAAVLPFLPLWADRVAMVVAGVWFVQPRQFHGRYRLDDRCRGCAGHRGSHADWCRWRIAFGADHFLPCAAGRNSRLRSLQSTGR